MARLIFIALLLIGLVAAFQGLARLWQTMPAGPMGRNQEDDLMPPVVRKFSYIGLLMIMFAAAAGALGGF